jgi:small subunit ribosomal protein S8
MSHSDPISDVLARIRNALMARHQTVDVNASKIVKAVLSVLKDEGYIEGYQEKALTNVHKVYTVTLKYIAGSPAINLLQRVSKPGCRRYSSIENIKMVNNGLGTIVVSTSKGVMTDRQARQLNVGGEIICKVF